MAWNPKLTPIVKSLIPIQKTDNEDYIVVLKSDKPCNKRIDLADKDKWQVTSYQKHYLFDFFQLNITDIHTLYEDLQELSEDEYHFLVYGRPTEYAIENAAHKMRRRKVSREDQPASLEIRSASIVLLDIDTLILPGLTFDATGAQQVVNKLIEKGLKELEDVTLIYQWTSKAGMLPNVARLRIIGLLESPASLSAIAAWATSCGVVDGKIYDPQQPIYIANPIFTHGAPPIALEDRMGLLTGTYDEIQAIPDAPLNTLLNAQNDNRGNPQEDDLILATLYEKGMVKSKLADGKYDITCPWVHEHTNEEDSGTVFMLPNYSGFKSHGFKCQHEHCSTRRTADLFAALNLDPSAEDNGLMQDQEEDDGSIDALIRRYAYVKDQDRFFDFLTGQLNKLEAINRSYSHIHMRPLAGTALLRRPELIRADSMVYLPGRPRVTRYNQMTVINMWRMDNEIVPTQGDASPWLDHVTWLLHAEEDREHFLDWAAFMLQNQDKKINHAILLGGAPRIGKDTLLDPIKKYLGIYNVSEPSAEELKETFTDYLHHTKLVVFQECQNFDKLNVENKLKPMLASPPATLRVRMFGLGFYETPNLVQCIFMSNHRNALKISRGDGRYYTIWSEEQPKDKQYYKDLYNWLENEDGHGKVINYLLTRDVSNFAYAAPPPVNEYKKLITNMSSTDLEMILNDRILNKEIPFHRDIIKPTDLLLSEGWQGVTNKKMTNALDAIGAIPKTCRESDGKRHTHTLWAIHNQSTWLKATPKDWLDYYNNSK